MDFIINTNIKDLQAGKLDEISRGTTNCFKLVAGKKAFMASRYSIDNLVFIVLGDLILPEVDTREINNISRTIKNHYIQNSIHHLKGFFYLIVFDIDARQIEVFSSFLNILPVYLFDNNEQILVSSSLMQVLNLCDKKPARNETFMVEKLLFNYAFLNNTPFQGIYLMPSYHKLRINHKGLKSIQNYNILDLINTSPLPWKKNLEMLSNVFIHEMEQYIPTEPFALTLTGGLDGRTVLSLAKMKGSAFETFSYGSSGDPDILIPKRICGALGLKHRSFILDKEYAVNRFWDDSLELTKITEGSANISRAHYILTAKELSQKYRFLLTGNFGSELIRSLKSPGLLASSAVFSLFESKEKSKFISFILNNPILRLMRKDMLQNSLKKVLDEAWEYREGLPKKLSLNEQLYLYVFGEVFRKYFGPEIILQSQYLINRSPFLDYNLISGLLKTSLPGIYNDFRETNPFTRFHGQILYSHILRKTYPMLLDEKLDKGYFPADFLSNTGKIRIAAGYFKQKVLKRNLQKSPSYSIVYYDFNKEKVEQLLVNSKIINNEQFQIILDQNSWRYDDQEFVNILSMELFYQKFI